MIRIIFLFLFILLFQDSAFSQKKEVPVYFKDFKKAVAKQDENKGKQVIYLDTICNYSLKLPTWLKLRETGKAGAIGGTFKAENGEDMAFLIKSFSRYTFNNYEEFGKWVVTGMIPGKPVSWSQEHICLEKKEPEKTQNGLPDYKVTIMHKGVAYRCRYILAETSSAYLWIEFSATGNNFDNYMKQFEEFLGGLEVKR